MRVLLTAAAACGLLIGASQAHAAVAFNLRDQKIVKGVSSIKESSFGTKNVDLKLEGFDKKGKKVAVTQTGLGTGVTSKGEGFKLFGLTFDVDPVDNGETLRLTFSKDFRLDSLCFSFVNGKHDKISITDGKGNSILSNSKLTSGFLDLTGKTQFSSVYNLTASGGNSDWFVTAVKGEVIPEPSTMLIWSALGVGALVWRRRKATRTAA